MDVTADRMNGLLVKADVAQRQLEREREQVAGGGAGTGGDDRPAARPGASDPTDPDKPAPRLPPTRYHGSVVLDSSRVGRDAGRIAEEVIAHLAGLAGSGVTVTLEIEARVPSGVPDNVVRIVTENGRTLKFGSQGFERD